MRVGTNLEKVWDTTYGDPPTGDNPFSDFGNSVILDGSGYIVGNVITLNFVDGLRGGDDLDPTNGSITDIATCLIKKKKRNALKFYTRTYKLRVSGYGYPSSGIEDPHPAVS